MFVQEYPIAVKRLTIAIAQARQYGLLGKNIFDSGFNFDIERLGAVLLYAGRTALMASVKDAGRTPSRPPFPAVKGVFKTRFFLIMLKPMQIYLRFERAGMVQNYWNGEEQGTKVFALGGKINNTGLVEVPMGTTLREIIYEIGGGIGR